MKQAKAPAVFPATLQAELDAAQPGWKIQLKEAIKNKDLIALSWLHLEVSSMYIVYGQPPPAGSTLVGQIFAAMATLTAHTPNANPVLKALNKMGVGSN